MPRLAVSPYMIINLITYRHQKLLTHHHSNCLIRLSPIQIPPAVMEVDTTVNYFRVDDSPDQLEIYYVRFSGGEADSSNVQVLR